MNITENKNAMTFEVWHKKGTEQESKIAEFRFRFHAERFIFSQPHEEDFTLILKATGKEFP